MTDPHAEGDGWSCYLAPGVEELLLDPAVAPALFGAILAATVAINEHQGDVPGHTASEKWPQQRRLPLGPGGVLGVAEYVVVAEANPPHCVLTRVQLY
ncbi:hypothetical protein FH609_028395 [Streptomyces sp. 3MP-14]|uniref:Uncharacterized protein n=1 Tax=Streptomyces mimosae TaxID=2586635 RepID=A0A5N5ZWE6_9ACTN|nr:MULTISPECIES: hypothetical protein [Streptomyces]KAB8160222.1 hypothetical protein FH607_026770 [Streptomyces mimosae]KAB8173016.1 hypothetical protein FH609_028395 [Streptomyces sp. 3MP-14]